MSDDDVERNLDTQARRLAELDEVISAALDDTTPPIELDASPRHQTYEQLTTLNDQLREQKQWTDIALDAALTEKQRQAWENWLQKHRLEWRTGDYLAVGAAGLVGLLCSWFDMTIDVEVRDQLKRLSDSSIVGRWEAAGKRLPVDYMGPGFGGRAHRVKSAGHDLARPVEAIRQVMQGEFRGIRWENGEAVPVVGGGFRGNLALTEASLKLAQHLLADVVTPMSLPMPVMSFLYEANNEALRQFALHSYSGLKPGTGWNLRSGVATPSMTVMVTEVLIRTYVHAEAYTQTGSAMLDLPQERRRTELLLAAHGLVSAISLGKVTAQVAAHAAQQNYLRAAHPSVIRHANIPALLRAGTFAATVVGDARRASQIPSARSWDELVVGSAQPWQLDLVGGFETTGSAFLE
ncbi:hypothetical protein [Gordonia sp. AC31]|uniref:hypothetical protein n=1 Tax=Gordonia sp. AC31 TaxID=2962571 RepID=UPI00288123C5|nr:hypothetical protein [Gordonia sp. AC31]MDT0220518.1 hypothetical protein [Gordonia sp. AC31]